LKNPAASCRESPKCKEVYYCNSLANPAASYGECARCAFSRSSRRSRTSCSAILSRHSLCRRRKLIAPVLRNSQLRRMDKYLSSTSTSSGQTAIACYGRRAAEVGAAENWAKRVIFGWALAREIKDERHYINRDLHSHVQAPA
jgi:hypothetical protein